MYDEELARLVNRSGFLFQLAVEDHVRAGKAQHEWDVVAREYPWAAAEHPRSGFIDFVAERNTLRCVFECKRTQSGEWIFLVPSGAAETIELRTLWSIVGQNNQKGWGWGDWGFHPQTLRSEFCIVRGASDDDKPMLERIAGDLVRAAESLAREELAMPNRYYGVYGYMPVVVTNAKLYACRVDTKQVDLTTGSLPTTAHFEEVKAIRFRKALATDLAHAPETYETLKRGLLAKERSVFVVNVNGLTEWLRGVKETSRPITMQAPWAHLLR